jgi:hypothetical protein
MITDRDIQVLSAIARYYVLNRAQIQRLCFPEDQTGRATRRRLQSLVSANLVNRGRSPVFNPAGGSAWPTYYPSTLGVELLAQHFDDERYLRTPTRAPHPLYILHWLAVADTHIALDQAIARQKQVCLQGWLNEWDEVDSTAAQPEKRYRIYTMLRERPRLVCVPDAAFLLAIGEYSKVFYLEQDRNTTGVRQFAARKTLGYAELAKQGLHRRHFPEATLPTFTVLAVAPTAGRRDALRKAVHGKPGADLWKFASERDLTAESFLHGPVFFPCDGEAAPLVKIQQNSASQQTQSTAQST